ncbi:MAG: NmrA family NAD(P)-binding protein [Candidatus Methylomirabilales bacterium]
MSKPMVLVTGAAGKTGSPVVKQLLEKDFPVRAFVRRRDARSENLEALGAKVVLGDFLDLASVRSAMQGVKRVYFCYPPQGDRLLEAATIVAVAARDAGVQAVVNMSQISARERASSALARHHWLSENVLDWANIGASHIHPTYFAEMLYILSGRSIAEEGKIYLPYGDERHAPVTAEDIARVVVGILADPEPHVGQHYILTGPRNMTIAEMAEVFTKELGKPIQYVNLPIEQWRRILMEKAGMPEFLASHLAHVAQDHQDGVFSAKTDIVERIGGRPPQSLQDFIRANAKAFGA